MKCHQTLEHIMKINLITTKMEINEFTNYIIQNKVNNIYVAEFASFESINGRYLPEFEDSQIFYVLDNKCQLLWTDSKGFYCIDDYLESKGLNSFVINDHENFNIYNEGINIFQFIDNYKKKYEDIDIWNNSPGKIYYRLRNANYKSFIDAAKSIDFFEGCIIDRNIYNKLAGYYNSNRFSNITDVIISYRGEFNNSYEIDEAQNYMAPDIKTFESIKLVKMLNNLMKFKDLTVSLLFALMIKYKHEMETKYHKKENIDITIDKLFEMLKMYMPKSKCKDFRIVNSSEELTKILRENLQFSLIGFLNYSDSSDVKFTFSSLKIYIDGSNIIHNGAHKNNGGIKNNNIKKPDVSFLSELIDNLKQKKISIYGIYIDINTIRYLNDHDRKEYDKYLKFKKTSPLIKTMETLPDEKADERLIQKLKDEPNCFVISNDSFEEYNLSDAEKFRLINFDRNPGSYNLFNSVNHEHLERIFEDNEKRLERYTSIENLKNLGEWPYRDKYDCFNVDNYIPNIINKISQK